MYEKDRLSRQIEAAIGRNESSFRVSNTQPQTIRSTYNNNVRYGSVIDEDNESVLSSRYSQS